MLVIGWAVVAVEQSSSGRSRAAAAAAAVLCTPDGLPVLCASVSDVV
jgi:hypothetical protein